MLLVAPVDFEQMLSYGGFSAPRLPKSAVEASAIRLIVRNRCSRDSRSRSTAVFLCRGALSRQIVQLHGSDDQHRLSAPSISSVPSGVGDVEAMAASATEGFRKRPSST